MLLLSRVPSARMYPSPFRTRSYAYNWLTLVSPKSIVLSLGARRLEARPTGSLRMRPPPEINGNITTCSLV